MNIKWYATRFPQIAHLEKSEQTALLGSARYEAFTKMKLSGRCMAYFICCLLLGFAIGVAGLVFFPASMFIRSIATIIGLLIALSLQQWLYTGLLGKGLERVLAAKKFITSLGTIAATLPDAYCVRTCA